jgi:predicted deacylase
MNINFQKEFERFQKLFSKLPKGLRPTRLSDHMYFLGPHEGEKIDLTLSAVIHGNEPGGLVVLNRMLEELCAIDITRGARVALLLGNIEAGHKKVRFIEKDLNRTFGETGTITREEQIARHLEPVLLKSKYVIDLHQTLSPTLSDFILTPQKEKNLKLAWSVASNVPIITHTEEFSPDGLCLDSFVSLRGQNAICYEMGSIDGTLEQTDKALNTVKNAFKIPENLSSKPKNILIMDESVPAGEGRELKEGFKNLSAVKAGEPIAQGKEPLIAKNSVHVLFPKYGEAAMTSKELCKLARIVPYEEQIKQKSMYE